ncbi:MAG TPA: hypothetical protein DCZ71_05635, partial [Ruminococcus sp.]|nr:hypothetical protein [Ruminococcus sp.]
KHNVDLLLKNVSPPPPAAGGEIRKTKAGYRFFAVLIRGNYEKILAIGIGMPFTAYAEDADPVLNDPDWNSYVEQSIDIDKTPGLAVAAINGPDVGFKNRGYANIKEETPLTEY